MALRHAHGKGADALLRVETSPADELTPLNAEDTSAAERERAIRGRPFQRGNSAARGRRPALASSAGMHMDSSDPDYKLALGRARRYRAARLREMKAQHGGSISSAVASMLVAAALDLASASYLQGLFAKTGDPELALKASKLRQSARQQELTALEVASREAEFRPKKVESPMDAIRRRVAALPAPVPDDAGQVEPPEAGAVAAKPPAGVSALEQQLRVT